MTLFSTSWRVPGTEGNEGRRTIAVFGGVLIMLWCIWWGLNIANGAMYFAENTWIRLPAFGVDFIGHVDRPVRMWMAGGDPYADKAKLFAYPPITLRLFVWVTLTTPQIALGIWIVLGAVCAAIGAAAAAQWRTRLGLEPLPGTAAIAAILFSTPVLFALERANYDLAIIPMIVAGLMIAHRRSPTAETIAGLLLALAVWAKLYPGLIIFGLLALTRWRLAAWTIAWSALIGLADPAELLRFQDNNAHHIKVAYSLASAFPNILPWNHPIAPMWPSLWAGTPLALIPGPIGSVLLIGGLVVWVSWRVFQSAAREALALPYLFWLIAAGTFVPPVSNDYNLTPLPLALLAVYSRRNAWAVVGLATLILWWQPVDLAIPGRVMMLLKLVGLIAVGGAIIHHAKHASNAERRRLKLVAALRTLGAKLRGPTSSNLGDERSQAA